VAVLADDPQAGRFDLSQRVALAHALVKVGHVREGEKRLLAEREKAPEAANIQYALGLLYRDERKDRARALQCFRNAVEANSRQPKYLLALARELYRFGELEECDDVLARIPRGFVEADALRIQRAVERGEEDAAQVARPLGQEHVVPKAAAYLRRGQPEQAVEQLQDALESDSSNRMLRRLLATAQFAMGQQDEAIEQWEQLVDQQPSDGSAYFGLALLLVRTMPPAEVAQRLSDMRGVYPYLVNLAMGRLEVRLGRHEQAERYLREVLDIQGVGSEPHYMARRHLIAALVGQEKYGQALQELDVLLNSDSPFRKGRLRLVRADLLHAMGRQDEAVALLDQIVADAAEQNSGLYLDRVASLYVQMDMPDKALRACDVGEKILSGEARPLVVRAEVLVATGRSDEAVEAYRAAIEAEPGEFVSYISLARLLDRLGRTDQAMDVLAELAEVSETGQVAALLEKGRLFHQRGLHARALACYEEIQNEGQYTPSRLWLPMARTVARLGDLERARELLGRVIPTSPQYPEAQLLLADLAEDDQQELQILDRLEEARPGQLAISARKARVRMRSGSAAEAADAMAELAEQYPDSPLPVDLAAAGLNAMLQADRPEQAQELAYRMAQQTGRPGWGWQVVWAVLESQLHPDQPDETLTRLDGVSAPQAAIVLASAVLRGDEQLVTQAGQRLDELKDERMSARQRVLMSLSRGRTDQARQTLQEVSPTGLLSREVAAELVSAAETEDLRREAAELLRISYLLEVPQGKSLGRSLALEALRQRSASRWAAIYAASGAPVETREQVLDLLQPDDCRTAQLLRAGALAAEGKSAEAADAYAAAGGDGRFWITYQEAQARERAGQLDRALALYRELWEQARTATAANNAAYLTSVLHQDQPERLSEARQWVDEAMDIVPSRSAARAYLLDTRGWLSHLQGESEQALRDLRQASRQLPEFAQVHYHLGRVEAEAGSRQVARWHLAAAVDLVEKRHSRGETVRQEEQEAAQQSRQWLARLGDES
ncbi:MAG: tetratricopeptide repeat protein, partial [Planctomycetota bacterium]